MASVEENLRLDDPVNRNLVFVILFMTVLLGVIGIQHPIGISALLYSTPIATAWTVAIWAIVIGWHVLAEKSETPSPSITRLRLVLFVLIVAAVPVFFGATNVLAHALHNGKPLEDLYDSTLLSWDDYLLGFIFPKGQLALYLDQHPVLGPESFFHMFCVEILQIFYFSYYIWGNALAIWLAIVYYQSASIGGPKPDSAFKTSLAQYLPTSLHAMLFPQGTSLGNAQQWRRLKLFAAAWTGTYLFNFLLNVAIPAVSPRIFLAAEYTHEIKGLFFADIIRAALKKAAANSYSAFPSGHCGLSWLAAFIALRFGYKTYGRMAAAAGGLITIATVFLRYHYFVDALCAVFLLAFGVDVGFMRNQEMYEAALETTDLKKERSPAAMEQV